MPPRSRSSADLKSKLQEVPVSEFSMKITEEVIKLLFWI